MRLFDYARLQPGMKVAAPVFGRDRLLLARDTELTRETIQRLPIWGIFHVFVHTHGEELAA